MTTSTAFSHPLYIMAKACGSQCNLACEYCYYLEKARLYQHTPRHLMTDETLEVFVRDYIAAQTSPHVIFTWHGGEPMLRPLSFYKKVVSLQKRYAQGRTVENSIQTNGTLLNDEWCRFLKDHHWLVGISIDGTAEAHNAFRKTKQGKPSHEHVLRGIRLLQQYGVEWNAMAVVNALNADDPQGFYRFFKSIGCTYLQFSPVVERLTQHTDGRHLSSADEDNAPLAPFSISPRQWGDFLCGVFDEWVKADVGRIFVQMFDATLANWVGQQPGLCTLARTCGHAAVMEYNGDVYACDHYVFPAYKIGNIHTRSVAEMMYDERQRQFGQAKYDRLTQQCRDCQYLFACYGECPRNRFVPSRDGEPRHNYLCEGYYRFFHHAAPYFDFMKRELLAGRPPANVMGVRF